MLAATLIVGVLVPALYTLAFVRVGINGSQSLPERTFAMVTWPKMIRVGAVVGFAPPDGVVGEWAEYTFIKRIAGVPGDMIERRSNAVCVRDRCFESAASALPLLDEAAVLEGYVFVAGEGVGSLDSRYKAIGLLPIEKIEMVGVALPAGTRNVLMTLAGWLVPRVQRGEQQ